MDKIKFYSLGSEKLDLFNIKKELEIDTSKVILAAPGFNNAMQKVIKKDIKSLNTKLEKLIKEINEISLKKEFNIKINPCFDMDNVSEIIEIVEKEIKSLIIENKKNKTGVLSLNKSKKKLRKESIDELIEYLTKCSATLVTMESEYKKLILRKSKFTPEEKNSVIEEKEDPLERTINFYINKNNEI